MLFGISFCLWEKKIIIQVWSLFLLLQTHWIIYVEIETKFVFYVYNY